MEKVSLPLLRGFISSFVRRRGKKRLLWLSRTENYLVGRETDGETITPKGDLHLSWWGSAYLSATGAVVG